MSQNLLFIGPVFNSYHKIIFKTIKDSGKYDNVYFLHECPLYSLALFGFITSIFPSIKPLLIKHFNKLILKCVKKRSIDSIFIIRGEYVKKETIDECYSLNPNLTMTAYNWDSIKNNSNFRIFLCPRVEAYTFDPGDANTEKNIHYLPLFSSWKETGYNISTYRKIYDISFVGGYREDGRMDYLSEMRALCERNKMIMFTHCFIRFGAYLKNRKRFNIKYQDITFEKMAYQKYLECVQKSKAVLDIQSSTQTGLTMRTMEVLSLGVKLVTTNKSIIKSEFYNENLVYVIDDIESIRENENEIIDFISKETTPAIEVLSLSEWLKQMNIV